MPHVLILLASYNHTVTDCAIKRLMSSDSKYLALLEKFLVNTFFGYKEVGKLFERIKNDKINWIKKNGELGIDLTQMGYLWVRKSIKSSSLTSA